ncbi:MAG: hypothetical protein GWO24_08475, partial [Akkermansiaceae bacterium]|nr:hypothetical protein [Akkermansiaceae bacterium]
MKPLLPPLAAAVLMTCSPAFLLAQEEEKAEEKAENKPKPEKKDYRTFTSKNGKSLEARVVTRIDDERYTIETPEGQSFTINIESLTRSDQTYLELWEPDAILDL